jgi:hypothetical protein
VETARHDAGYIIVIGFLLALRVSQYRSRCIDTTGRLGLFLHDIPIDVENQPVTSYPFHFYPIPQSR